MTSSLMSFESISIVPQYVFAVFLMYLLYQYPIRYFFFNDLKKHTPSGPPSSSWIVGARADLIANKEWENGDYPNKVVPWYSVTSIGNFKNSYIYRMETYGDIFHFRAFLFSDRLFVADPDALKHIMVTDSSNYPRCELFRKFITPFTGKYGLFGKEGEDHLRQRRLLNPHFSAGHIKGFNHIFEHHAELLIKQFNESADKEISMNDKFTELTLDIIGVTAFGYKFNSLTDSNNEVKLAYDALMEPYSQLSVFGVLFIPGFKDLPFEAQRKKKNASRVINEAVEGILLSKLSKTKDANSVDQDLLDVILDSVREEKNPNTQKQLIEEAKSHILTFLVAGHETTTYAFCWFFAILSKYPDVQVKVQNECKAVLKEANEGGRKNITMKDATQLTYLTACLYETFRLYPVVSGIPPRVAKDDNLLPTVSGNKLFIPKGTDIVTSLIGIHRNSKYWTTADEFHPERFLEGSQMFNQDSKLRGGRSRNFFFFPFGIGPKTCIGNRFAMAELQVILSNLMARFEFRCCGSSNINPHLKTIALAPKDLRMTVHRIVE